MKSVFKNAQQRTGVMESETILKNGASPKSRTSRRDFISKAILFFIVICFTGSLQGQDAVDIMPIIIAASMDGASAGYAGSVHTIKGFKKRLAQAEKDKDLKSEYYGFYAGSQLSLKSFKKRLAKVEEDGELSPEYYGYYASSQHTLAYFKRRLKDAQDDEAIDPKYYGCYAGACSLTDRAYFKASLKYAEKDESLDPEYYGYYAGSSAAQVYGLVYFKRRLKGAEEEGSLDKRYY